MYNHKAKEFENSILIEVCLELNEFDENLTLIDFNCIKDMIEMQKQISLFANVSRTKNGKLRKNSSFSNMLENRLDFAINQLHQLELEVWDALNR